MNILQIKKDFFVILSICSTALILCPLTNRGIVCMLLFGIICILAYGIYRRKAGCKKVLVHNNSFCLVASMIITCYLVCSLITRIKDADRYAQYIDSHRLSSLPFSIVIILCLSVGTFYTFYILFSRILLSSEAYSFTSGLLQSTANSNNHKYDTIAGVTIKEKLCIFFCAVFIITICSRSSPLYPFNTWGDVNCFFTVGKGMFNRLVPYRDLLEQKGPLLYFLYGLAWVISHDTFIGGYVLEIIAAVVFLCFSYKTTILLTKEKYLFLVPIIAVLTYTPAAFEQGGSAEEICLPLIAFSLYLFLQASESMKHSLFSFFLIGVAAGCIFWIKFTLVGLYIGVYVWLIWDSFIRKTVKKELLYDTLMLGCGVIVATIPWIIYFGVNNAIIDWLEVYIYDNLFVYQQIAPGTNCIDKIPIIGKLLLGYINFQENNVATSIVCIIGFVVMYAHKRERVAQFFMFSIISSFLFIYVGGRYFRYYSLIMDVFLAPCIALFIITLSRKTDSLRARKFIILSMVICLICSFVSPNLPFVKVKKSDLAQFKFEEIINSDSKDATILNYGFLDGGFYTVCNKMPNCKAFCRLNISLNEMTELQERYVSDGLCDYVITIPEEGKDDLQKSNKYVCISECYAYYTYEKKTFRLYKLK